MTRSAPSVAALEQGRDRAPRHSVERLVRRFSHGGPYGAWKIAEKSGDVHCDEADKNRTPRSHRRKKVNRRLRPQPEHLTSGKGEQGSWQDQPEAQTPREN